MHQRAVAGCLLALVAMVATSCIKSEVDVTVKGDGSGQIVVEAFPDRDLVRSLEDVDLEALVQGSWSGDSGVELDRIEEDGRDGFRLIVPFDDYQDLGTVLVDGLTVAGQNIKLFSAFSLVEAKDGYWALDATLNPLGQAIGDGGPIDIAGLETFADVIEEVGSGKDGLTLKIALPGTVVSSNADSIDGGTATWNLSDPEAPTTLNAKTEPKEFPTPVQLVVGGGIAAVALGLLLFLVGATRKQRVKQPKAPKQPKRPKPGGTADADVDPRWAAPPDSPASPPPLSARPQPLPALTLTEPAPTPIPASPVASEPESAAEQSGTNEVAAVVPAEAGDTALPAGWYPDPVEADRFRWWDGTAWTDHQS